MGKSRRRSAAASSSSSSSARCASSAAGGGGTRPPSSRPARRLSTDAPRMVDKAARTAFVCQQCGRAASRWLGQCPGCGAWNALVEEAVRETRARETRTGASAATPRPLVAVTAGDTVRRSTGLGELDRVLGGGLVQGSVVLVGGDPGIGKSTLALQACGALARQGLPVLYVAGEESPEQVRLRAERLGMTAAGVGDVQVLPETAAEAVVEQLERTRPAAGVVDSIQALHTAAPDGNRARRRAGGASPRGPREAPRHAAPRPGRLPQCRRGPARRRAGGGPGRRRGGRLERARPGGRRGRGRVGRGRPDGRGAGRRPRRRAAARGGAAGVPPLRAAGDERPRPRGSRRRRARGGRVARPALRRAGAPMTFLVLFWLNVLLLAVFAVILMRPQLLGFAKGGKWYLTWLSIGVITLMDELTSVFYAPAEAHRFIGMTAIFFIAFTSLLMRVLSTRMVEISEILELHGLRGGGVYSFSYFVLGPVASFVAVASIMVDYILPACISTAGAVINGTAFVALGAGAERLLVLGIIWAVAGLNIIGIRENARVTFGIFVAAAFVFLNLITLGILNLEPSSPARMWQSGVEVYQALHHHTLAHAVSVITIGVASCVLAYSGIESVIQTAGLVE